MKPVDDLAIILKAFADPSRLRIITLLANSGGAYCVNGITKKLEISQSAVSQHLRILRHIGLVTPHRMGAQMHYSLNSALIEKVQSYIDSLLKKQMNK